VDELAEPDRRFTIGDGAILIAGTALGLGFWIARQKGNWGVGNNYRPIPSSPQALSYFACSVSLGMAWVVLLAPIRLHRRGRGLVACSPGFVAALAIVVTSLLDWYPWIKRAQGVNSMSYWDELLWGYTCENPSQYAPALATSWLVLWIGRRWSRPADWTDRLGRLLGIGTLALALIHPFLPYKEWR
jgi:hypothetical protein